MNIVLKCSYSQTVNRHRQNVRFGERRRPCPHFTALANFFSHSPLIAMSRKCADDARQKIVVRCTFGGATGAGLYTSPNFNCTPVTDVETFSKKSQRHGASRGLSATVGLLIYFLVTGESASV